MNAQSQNKKMGSMEMNTQGKNIHIISKNLGLDDRNILLDFNNQDSLFIQDSKFAKLSKISKIVDRAASSFNSREICDLIAHLYSSSEVSQKFDDMIDYQLMDSLLPVEKSENKQSIILLESKNKSPIMLLEAKNKPPIMLLEAKNKPPIMLLESKRENLLLESRDQQPLCINKEYLVRELKKFYDMLEFKDYALLGFMDYLLMIGLRKNCVTLQFKKNRQEKFVIQNRYMVLDRNKKVVTNENIEPVEKIKHEIIQSDKSDKHEIIRTSKKMDVLKKEYIINFKTVGRGCEINREDDESEQLILREILKRNKGIFKYDDIVIKEKNVKVKKEREIIDVEIVNETKEMITAADVFQDVNVKEIINKKIINQEIDVGVKESINKKIINQEIDVGVKESINKKIINQEIDVGVKETINKKIINQEIDVGVKETINKKIINQEINVGVKEAINKKIINQEIDVGELGVVKNKKVVDKKDLKARKAIDKQELKDKKAIERKELRDKKVAEKAEVQEMKKSNARSKKDERTKIETDKNQHKPLSEQLKFLGDKFASIMRRNKRMDIEKELLRSERIHVQHKSKIREPSQNDDRLIYLDDYRSWRRVSVFS
ncbi:MAG: hypothetical protein ATN31_08950 [Candidatus Epulonipiscioides saccharophilum]|nr:MAG: hypothetical protein ATN31_08950 [Epulopiscium sp. AS2M-Bin001]